MRKPIIFLLVALMCLGVVFVKPIHSTFRSLIAEIKEEHEGEEGEEEGETEEEEKQERERMAGATSSWFWARAYPDPYYLNDKYQKGWQQVRELTNNASNTRFRTLSGTWTSIGPNTTIGGRILTIAIDPTNNQKMWCGTASGGMFKTTNGGALWSPVVTNTEVLGVSSIVIHPTNGTILAGTGEVYRVDSTSGTPNPSNIGFNVWKTRGTYGVGILRSTDGGVTWTQHLNKSTSQLFGIQMIKYDNSNSSIVYACATDGLYKSTDGGVNWTLVYAITYVTDVEANGNNIVIAVGNMGNTLKGIWKSTDGGVNFYKKTLATATNPHRGFIKMDCVPAAPNMIVASVGVDEVGSPNELFRSTDFGDTWTALASSFHADYQCWSAHALAINPSNTNSVVYGGVNWYIYNISAGTSSGTTNGHSDVHDFEFDPTNNNIAYICTDGGIYKSTNGGASWGGTPLNNGLGATQFYAPIGVSLNNAANIVVAGGLQDNQQWYYVNGTWAQFGGAAADGAGTVIDPTNESRIVFGRDAHQTFLSLDRGVTKNSNLSSWWGNANDSRTAFAAPVAMARSAPGTMYLGTDEWHTSTGNAAFSGATPSTLYIDAKWKTAVAVEVSPVNPQKVYVSVGNFAQFDNDVDQLHLTGTPNVLKTLNGARPFTSIMGSAGNTLPNRYVMDFAISRSFDDSVFAAIGGFGTPHIYVTGNGGATWSPCSVGLPDLPFNCVLIDPVNWKTVYAGGDGGIWVSPNRGANWYNYSTGLTDATQIIDIQPASNNTLIAASHGKGIFQGARYTGILPVNLLSFTGEAQGASNILQWRVDQERNMSHYAVERSSDGVSYTTIAMVPPTNSSKYSYSDNLVFGGTFYYRLKTVDKDNVFQYSSVVAIRRDGTAGMRVLGNPFTNAIDIRLTTATAGKTVINLYDAGGKLLKSNITSLNQGQNAYSMQNLSGLPNGVYVIEAIIANQRWKERVVKK